MEPIEKKTRLTVALVTACALLFSGLFSCWPEALGFTQTAAALGYEDTFDSASILRVDITADESDWQSMLDNAMNEEWIECDVALNGEKISSAGIRCKGNSSLSMTEDERYSFKISFGKYVKDQTFHGLDKMVLNNTQSDNTFIKEYLSYYLMNRAGVKTPLFAMAEIYINDTYWGLYLAVECIDDSFIERNFSTDGGFLYKPDGTAMGNMGDMGNFSDIDFSEIQTQLESLFSEGGFPTLPDNMGDMTPPDTSSTADSGSAPTLPDSMGDMTPPDMGSTAGGSSAPTLPDSMGDMTPPDMGSTADGSSAPTLPDSMGDMTPPDMGSTAGGGSAPTLPDSMGDMTPPDMSDMNGGFAMPSMGGDSQSGAALGYLGDDIDLYADIFDYAKTNTPSDADKARLVAALKSLSEGDLDSSLNVSEAIGWLAVNALLVNDDGYLGSMLHNYYLYELNGQLTLLPWDYNLAFGGFAGGSAASAVNDPIDTPASTERPLVTALLSNDECLEAYHALLRELGTFLSDGSMDQLITELAAMIDSSVQNDPTRECTYEEFLTGIETLRAFCTLRGQSILGQLDGTIPSTDEGQSADSSALLQADFNLSDMGAQGGGKGGFGGGKMNFGQGEANNPFSRQNALPDSTDTQTTASSQTPPNDVPARPDGDTASTGDVPAHPDGDTASTGDVPARPDGDTTPTGDISTEESGDTGDSASDTNRGFDRMQRREGGMPFGNGSTTAQNGSSFTYALVLDLVAALCLIAALIFITRRSGRSRFRSRK